MTTSEGIEPAETKRWQTVVFAILSLAVVVGVYLYVQVRTIDVESLSDDLFLLRDFDGNVAVLHTDAGARCEFLGR